MRDWSYVHAFLAVAAALLLGFLSVLARTPHQSIISNISGFVCATMGWKKPPAWLEDGNADRVAYVFVRMALVALAWGAVFQFLDVGSMKLIPAVAIFGGLLAVTAGTVWHIREPAAVSPPAPVTPQSPSTTNSDAALADAIAQRNSERMAREEAQRQLTETQNALNTARRELAEKHQTASPPPSTAAAPSSAPAAAQREEPKPHYSRAELETMLGVLGDLQTIFLAFKIPDPNVNAFRMGQLNGGFRLGLGTAQGAPDLAKIFDKYADVLEKQAVQLREIMQSPNALRYQKEILSGVISEPFRELHEFRAALLNLGIALKKAGTAVKPEEDITLFVQKQRQDMVDASSRFFTWAQEREKQIETRIGAVRQW